MIAHTAVWAFVLEFGSDGAKEYARKPRDRESDSAELLSRRGLKLRKLWLGLTAAERKRRMDATPDPDYDAEARLCRATRDTEETGICDGRGLRYTTRKGHTEALQRRTDGVTGADVEASDTAPDVPHDHDLWRKRKVAATAALDAGGRATTLNCNGRAEQVRMRRQQREDDGVVRVLESMASRPDLRELEHANESSGPVVVDLCKETPSPSPTQEVVDLCSGPTPPPTDPIKAESPCSDEEHNDIEYADAHEPESESQVCHAVAASLGEVRDEYSNSASGGGELTQVALAQQDLVATAECISVETFAARDDPSQGEPMPRDLNVDSSDQSDEEDDSSSEDGEIDSSWSSTGKSAVDVELSPVLAAVSLRAPRRYQPARWPGGVAPLSGHFNPSDLVLPKYAPFSKKCKCAARCRYATCSNASPGVFCDKNCCPYNGICGNGILTHPNLQLVKIKNTTEYGVIATGPIEAGVTIGQYTGEISRRAALTEKEIMEDTEHNSGYRLVMGEPAVRHKKWCIIIDAAKHGTLRRFLNHACDTTAVVEQLANGRHHTIVAVTRRDLVAGDEVTVDYGRYLWFRCQCGGEDCCHVDLSSTQP